MDFGIGAVEGPAGNKAANAPRPFLRRGEGVERRVFASKYRKPTRPAATGAHDGKAGEESFSEDGLATRQEWASRRSIAQDVAPPPDQSQPQHECSYGSWGTKTQELAADTELLSLTGHTGDAPGGELPGNPFLRHPTHAAWARQQADEELELEEFRALESQIKADVVGLDVGAARAGSASGGSEQRQQQQRKGGCNTFVATICDATLASRTYAAKHTQRQNPQPALPPLPGRQPGRAVAQAQATAGPATDDNDAAPDDSNALGHSSSQFLGAGGFLGGQEQGVADGLGGGFGAPAGTRAQGAGPPFGLSRTFGADPGDGEEADLDAGQQEGLDRGQGAGGPGAAGGYVTTAFDDSDAWDDISSFRGAGAGGGGGGLGRKAGGGGFGQRARAGQELSSHDQVAGALDDGGEQDDERGPDQPFVRALFNKQRQQQQMQGGRGSKAGAKAKLQPDAGPSAAELERMQALDEQLAAVATERANLVRMRTELEKTTNRLEQERQAWERTRAEEQSRWEAQREVEEAKLRRDKRVLEKQSKALLKLPNKKERTAMEAAEAALEAERREGRAREARHKLTVERLRRQLLELQEKNHELREEVRWHEAQQLERDWDPQGAGLGRARPCRAASTQTDPLPHLQPLDPLQPSSASSLATGGRGGGLGDGTGSAGFGRSLGPGPAAMSRSQGSAGGTAVRPRSSGAGVVGAQRTGAGRVGASAADGPGASVQQQPGPGKVYVERAGGGRDGRAVVQLNGPSVATTGPHGVGYGANGTLLDGAVWDEEADDELFGESMFEGNGGYPGLRPATAGQQGRRQLQQQRQVRLRGRMGPASEGWGPVADEDNGGETGAFGAQGAKQDSPGWTAGRSYGGGDHQDDAGSGTGELSPQHHSSYAQLDDTEVPTDEPSGHMHGEALGSHSLAEAAWQQHQAFRAQIGQEGPGRAAEPGLDLNARLTAGAGKRLVQLGAGYQVPPLPAAPCVQPQGFGLQAAGPPPRGAGDVQPRGGVQGTTCTHGVRAGGSAYFSGGHGHGQSLGAARPHGRLRPEQGQGHPHRGMPPTRDNSHQQRPDLLLEDSGLDEVGQTLALLRQDRQQQQQSHSLAYAPYHDRYDKGGHASWESAGAAAGPTAGRGGWAQQDTQDPQPGAPGQLGGLRAGASPFEAGPGLGRHAGYAAGGFADGAAAIAHNVASRQLHGAQPRPAGAVAGPGGRAPAYPMQEALLGPGPAEVHVEHAERNYGRSAGGSWGDGGADVVGPGAGSVGQAPAAVAAGARQVRHADGKLERLHPDGRRAVLFPNGTRKVVLPDGTSRVYFTNGDIKWTVPASACGPSAPGGVVHYYYAEVDTWHSTYGSAEAGGAGSAGGEGAGSAGLEVFHFPSGQTEAHHPSAFKEIIYPDGVVRVVIPDGREVEAAWQDLSWAIQQPQPDAGVAEADTALLAGV